MIGPIVYLMCAFTSVLCFVLLLLKYRRNRLPILFWSSLGFLGIALNNVFLFVDLVIMPVTIDLSMYRIVIAFIGVSVMVWGFIRSTV